MDAMSSNGQKSGRSMDIYMELKQTRTAVFALESSESFGLKKTSAKKCMTSMIQWKNSTNYFCCAFGTHFGEWNKFEVYVHTVCHIQYV